MTGYQHLVDPYEAFWELSLLGRAQVHPHSSLSVPLQSISPPLTGGRPLSGAHPAHAPALQLHLCDAIFIYHPTQSRRSRKGSSPTLAAFSSGFLKRNQTQTQQDSRTRETVGNRSGGVLCSRCSLRGARKKCRQKNNENCCDRSGAALSLLSQAVDVRSPCSSMTCSNLIGSHNLLGR